MPPWDDDEAPKHDPEDRGTYCEMCEATGKWINLFKCPMCHKYFCEACRYAYGGKDFCTSNCANEFFWGSEEGEDDE